MKACPYCQGTGLRNDKQCWACFGSGNNSFEVERECDRQDDKWNTEQNTRTGEEMSNLTKVTPETFAAIEAHVDRAQRLHPWHVNKRYRGFLLNAPRGDEDVSASEIIKSEWQELAIELLNVNMREERLQRVLDEALDLTVVAMRLVQKAIDDIERLKGAK